MSKLDHLYQQVIIDHSKKPRNFGHLEECTHCAHGHNPLCGDEVRIFLKIKDDAVIDIKFIGNGCSISLASASMMTQALIGKSRADAERLFREFQMMVTGAELSSLDALGRLSIFDGVKRYPSRVKCAVLPWHTMNAALGSPCSLLPATCSTE